MFLSEKQFAVILEGVRYFSFDKALNRVCDSKIENMGKTCSALFTMQILKVDYRRLPSFKSGKGPCRSLKGEVQIAIDVKLKFRFICLQIDTVMLPKMEFP